MPKSYGTAGDAKPVGKSTNPLDERLVHNNNNKQERPPTRASLAGQSCATYRIVKLVIALVFISLTTFVVAGHPALKPVFMRAGVFSNLCSTSVPSVIGEIPTFDCTEQKLRMDLMFILAFGVAVACCVPFGYFIQNGGSKGVCVVGCFCLGIGSVMFGLSTAEYEFYLPAYLLMGIGGTAILFGLFPVIDLFPSHHAPFIYGAMLVAQQGSAGVFYGFQLLYEKCGVSLRQMFVVYTGVPGLLLLLSFWLLSESDAASPALPMPPPPPPFVTLLRISHNDQLNTRKRPKKGKKKGKRAAVAQRRQSEEGEAGEVEQTSTRRTTTANSRDHIITVASAPASSPRTRGSSGNGSNSSSSAYDAAADDSKHKAAIASSSSSSSSSSSNPSAAPAGPALSEEQRAAALPFGHADNSLVFPASFHNLANHRWWGDGELWFKADGYHQLVMSFPYFLVLLWMFANFFTSLSYLSNFQAIMQWLLGHLPEGNQGMFDLNTFFYLAWAGSGFLYWHIVWLVRYQGLSVSLGVMAFLSLVFACSTIIPGNLILQYFSVSCVVVNRVMFAVIAPLLLTRMYGMKSPPFYAVGMLLCGCIGLLTYLVAWVARDVAHDDYTVGLLIPNVMNSMVGFYLAHQVRQWETMNTVASEKFDLM